MVIEEVSKQLPLKRKREKQEFQVLTREERESRLKTLNEELESLFQYFDEFMSADLGLGLQIGSNVSSKNAVIAALCEEKRCSYSKLVGEIFEKVKERDSGATIASVKSSLLYVGHRVPYGVLNADVDVLEDETPSCLWCWETRDMKMLPSSVRGALKIRRTCRRKINERITAILDVISCLQKPEDHQAAKADMRKAADKLSKVLAEADIRSLMESFNQNNNSELAEKVAKKNSTFLINEFEKNKREEEKEKKRIELELKKQQVQIEEKLLQQEAEKDEKRREKEELEMRKQRKRKQEEADKELRQKEKDDVKLKKQLSIKKKKACTSNSKSGAIATIDDASKDDVEINWEQYSTNCIVNDLAHEFFRREFVSKFKDDPKSNRKELTLWDIYYAAKQKWDDSMPNSEKAPYYIHALKNLAIEASLPHIPLIPAQL